MKLQSARFLLLALVLCLLTAACGSVTEKVGDAAAESVESAVADEEHKDEEHKEDEPDDDEEHDDDDDHESSRGLGSHEHGSAELSVAWVSDEVFVDLVSPTQNVFGFEYEPATDEDKATAADRTAAIAAAGMITINDSAGCELSGTPKTAVEQEASHSEIAVSWAFSCANPGDVSTVDLSGLFAEFPGFEDIDVEWLSDTDQSSAELSPQQPTLSLQS